MAEIAKTEPHQAKPADDEADPLDMIEHAMNREAFAVKCQPLDAGHLPTGGHLALWLATPNSARQLTFLNLRRAPGQLGQPRGGLPTSARKLGRRRNIADLANLAPDIPLAAVSWFWGSSNG